MKNKFWKKIWLKNIFKKIKFKKKVCEFDFINKFCVENKFWKTDLWWICLTPPNQAPIGSDFTSKRKKLPRKLLMSHTVTVTDFLPKAFISRILSKKWPKKRIQWPSIVTIEFESLWNVCCLLCKPHVREWNTKIFYSQIFEKTCV